MRDDCRVQLSGWRAFARALGEGPAVVALHGGLGLDHTHLSPWLDWLSERGRVVYFDQRGCGRSTGRDLLPSTSLADWAADLEALRQALDLGPIVLFGFCASGTIALEYARRFGDNLRGLVLCSTYPALDFIDRTLAHIETRVAPAAHERLMSYLTSPSGDDEAFRHAMLGILPAYFAEPRPQYLSLLGRTSRFSAAAFERHMATLADFDATPWLADLQAPTLVVGGALDGAFPPPAGAERLAHGIPGSRLALLQASGHFPFVEEPSAFRTVLTAWLDEIEA